MDRDDPSLTASGNDVGDRTAEQGLTSPSGDTEEVPLLGGRITPGVVCIGDTVRRPVSPASPFVHELLLHLERVGFTGAPRFLGIDERGREILSFIDGTVPPDLDPELSDEQLTTAAHLLRRYVVVPAARLRADASVSIDLHASARTHHAGPVARVVFPHLQSARDPGRLTSSAKFLPVEPRPHS